MADRATIDTMNKVLDNLFGTKKYAGGTPQGVGRGNPQASRDSLQDYAEELLMGGLSPQQVAQVLARTHYQMKGHGNADLGIAELTAELQKDLTRRQETLQPQMQSFRYDQRNAFVAYHAKNAALTGHTKNIEDELTRLGITDPQEREMYKKEAYTARSTTYAFPALNRELESVQGSSKPELEKWRKSLGRIVTRDVKFDQMLHAIGVGGSMGHMIAKPVRKLIRATETGLVGQHAFNVPQSAARNYKSSPKQANLTPISLPANPAAITQSLAVKFVAEQRRQQAMQQSASLGQSLSRSNFLKTLARQNKPSGQASSVNLNFLGSRSTHQPTLFDRLRESKLGRRLGFESTNPVNYKAAGVGLAGGLSYLAMQYAPQAIDALSSGLAHMAGGFFARGGSVPGYAYGGDPLRNIHLTKSPESASKLIGSNVVNSLQSDANSTGLYGLLQSMIKSGSTDASFRGLFYRKGLDANTWMEKVHQMKLQSADTFMNGYFAQGGVPRYAKGTSDEIPFNFKHFQIGRNSKFIKQMFDLSAPYMNDSDGQYQMFRAIENKKMGPKDFGLLAATLKDMNPVSALSYQSDGSGIEMTDLGTHPKFQKQGFGQVLLAEMLNIGKDKGLDLATWSANSDEAAGYYNYLGAKEGENKSFTFDLNEWTGKFAKRRALGGDTFTQQLASGPNSQISADAIKRLQLLRIRAQAGQRLAGLRDNAQLNMQLGNTSLFRSPNTAAGVINARVLNNLQSIFSGQKGQKFATGGSTLNNPIRVSDGELAIPRGMVDKIGLSTLRRINAGDMSGLQGFSAGGMFEFDGPGTGTSDSILTDADRGPKGQDASDIGFIIRRTSSDRLKSIVGRAMGGIIPGFIGGGNPFTDLTDFSNRLNARVADPKTGDNIFAMPRRTVVPQINSVLAANPSGSATDIYKAILTSEKYLKTIQKNVGFERGTEYTTVLKDVLQDAFGQKIDVAEPVFDGVKKFDQALVAVTDSLNKQNVKLKENLKVIDNKSSDRSYSGTVVGDDAATGTYRGELDYPQMRGSHFGETDVTDFVESGPENPPGRNDILSQGMGPRGTGGIGAWWNRNISGHLARVGKEVFDPTEMQYRVQGNIEMPIGAVGYQTEEQRAQLESNRREYNTYGDDLKARVREQFGDVLGNLDIDELVKVTQGTKQADRRFATGVNVDEKGNVTADTKPMQVTVGTIQVNATALQSKLQGKMNADEFDARMQRAMRPSAGAMAGVHDNFGFEQFKDGEQIQKATVNVSRFHEEVKKVNMTQTGLYKMGDILRGLSWRFASLGMSAMGVYFSIQGLMMTFQQGIGAITTPLADIEALMKNIGMSTAFGDGIMNASKAMEQLNVGRDDFIDGWKNLTNIQGTIQTLFASIGAKIFGGEKGKEFTDELLSGITDAFDELDKGGITEVVRDLLSSIVEALPAILPAIKTITGMLQEMAKNKALVSMGAQLMMLSLVVQPLASGLAAIVTILGGMFTFGNLFNVFAKGFFATAVASEAAAGGITAMGIALRVLTAATVIGGVILLYEVVANLANALNLLGDFKLPTLTGWALNAMSGGNGYASGGEIGGTPTAAIDDKTINVEEGEFVVRKDVAQRHRGELAQFNKTGVWPGSQKMAGGGFLGPSMGASVSAVETTYQSNKTATLMEDGNRYGYNTQQVLTDVQNGDALNVFVKNMPDSWGNGSGNQQMPFDMGYPYHLNINPTPFSPDFKGFIPNPVVDNPTGITPVWNRDTTGIINPDVNVAPDKNVNPTEQPNPNTQGTNENTTGITPTSSALNYIGQIINQAFDQVVEAFQGAVDGIVGGFFAVMEAAHSAAESIANFAGAIGQSLGNMSAKPLVDFFKGTGDNEGTPTSGGLGFRANSGDWLGGLRKTDYEDLLYNHGGYTKYGDKTNYLADSTKRSGVIDQYRKGRILPQGALPDGMEGLGPRMREIWPTKQLIRKDFPYDYGEVGRALTTGDPYQVALAGASATASNAIVGGVGKGLQYGALRMGGTLTGGALARVGAGFSQMNMMGGNPLVFAGAHYLESGQAFDEFMEGRSTEDSKTGEFNAVTGALTGGFSTAGFGKGMDVWGSFFGLDENQMRERLKANEGLMNFGIKDVNPLNVLFGDEAWDAGWDKLKGGNRAVSDILESASFKVGDFDIGKGAGDIASAVNKGVFDAIQQTMNLDVGTIFGAGTSAIGIGAGLVETAGNTAQMAMENPWSMAQLGITAGVPLIGPFLAAMGMPQTTDWITNTKGYGSQDVTPESMGLSSEPFDTTNNYEAVTNLTTAINNLTSQQSQQQIQPIIVYLTNQINGEELATKGYVETKIQTEVPKVMSDNKPRIVGH